MRRLIPLAAVLLISLPVFSQSVKFNIIQLSQGLSLVGDFNADGREDGIGFTGSGASTAFHLLITTGTGTYTASTSYNLPNGESERGFRSGDFNNDGKLDLAIATSASNLDVYRGNGDGTFASPTTLSLPFIPIEMIAADVNHDGKMDLVLLNEPGGNQASTIMTFFGNGSGGFTAGPSSPAGGIYNMQTGDFDGDGKVDLFSAMCGPGGCSFIVNYGDGTGRFGSPTTASVNQSSPTVADVDGDGKSDIITSTMGYINSTDQPYLSVFYGAANRTLQFGKVPTSECTFGHPAVADFNGDHIPDIIFPEHDCSNTSNSSAQMAFLAGKGNRTFGSEQTVFNSTYQQQPGPDTTVLRANNSDSKPDFLFSQNANRTTGNPWDLFLMVNESSGTFAGCRPPNTPTGFRICLPASGSTVSSPVKFSFSAAWQVPMRKTEVWVDGVKKFQSRYAFSRYGFLDANVALTPGTHAVTVVGAGWDNSIESKKYSITVP
jgi:hypothetical protein